jgi:hypothetical protein
MCKITDWMDDGVGLHSEGTIVSAMVEHGGCIDMPFPAALRALHAGAHLNFDRNASLAASTNHPTLGRTVP